MTTTFSKAITRSANSCSDSLTIKRALARSFESFRFSAESFSIRLRRAALSLTFTGIPPERSGMDQLR